VIDRSAGRKTRREIAQDHNYSYVYDVFPANVDLLSDKKFNRIWKQLKVFQHVMYLE
jgi:hypothetical protein